MLTFAFYFFVLGVISLVWAFISFVRAKSSVAWPSARGVITRSEVIRFSTGYGWQWFIEYHYSVLEKHYHGRRVYFGSNPTIATARTLVATYCIGRDVSVRYHPDKPELCVLMPGVSLYTWSALAIGPLFFVMGLAFIYWGF